MTWGQRLFACLAASAVAALCFALLGAAYGPALLGHASGLGAVAAPLAVALTVPLTLRAGGLKSVSPARRLSVTLALYAYAIGWGLRLPGLGALAAGPTAVLEVLDRAASLSYRVWLFDGLALAFVAVAALTFADLLFAGLVCRSCGSRCRQEGDTVECAAPPLDEVRAQVRARRWSFFRPLGPPSRRGLGLRFRLYSCRCRATSCFDLVLLRRFGRTEVLVQQEPLPPEEMRVLRKVTYDILHPARAADWLVPTQARIRSALATTGRPAGGNRLLRFGSADRPWRLTQLADTGFVLIPGPEGRTPGPRFSP